MKINLGKISLLILLLAPLTLFAQKEELIIKVDTIYTEKTKILKLVRVRTVPKFILQFDFAYNNGSMELNEHNGGFSQGDFTLGKSFGTRHGFGFKLTGKLPLTKKGNFWLDIIAGYDRFQSDLFTSGTQDGKVYYNSINNGVGVEYNFTPNHKMKYYVGISPMLSIISGKATGLINPENNKINVTVKSSVRLGYAAFLGLEYAFEKNFGFNMGLKFTHANLLLKNSEEGTQEEGVNYTIPLNDDSSDDIQFAGWKQFAYVSGTIGFSYFFGVKERRYKLP